VVLQECDLSKGSVEEGTYWKEKRFLLAGFQRMLLNDYNSKDDLNEKIMN
jgi:hypothetical protein